MKPFEDFYSQEKFNAKGEKYIYYHPCCKICATEKSKKRQQENREELLEYKKNWYRNRWELEREQQRKWYIEHKEGRSEYGKIYRKENKDKFKEYRDRYSNKQHDITDEEWMNCKNYFNNECAYCGMTHDEHKLIYNQDLHRDHVDSEGANDITNCVPACKSCNVSKWKHDLEYWYTKRDFYDESKLYKIHEWLNVFK